MINILVDVRIENTVTDIPLTEKDAAISLISDIIDTSLEGIEEKLHELHIQLHEPLLVEDFKTKYNITESHTKVPIAEFDTVARPYGGLDKLELPELKNTK